MVVPTILSDNAGHKSAFEYMNSKFIYTLGDLDALTRMISGSLMDLTKKLKQCKLFQV
ncbi:MAG: hypothetical protein ACLRWM_06070 [Streptococcus sp.]